MLPLEGSPDLVALASHESMTVMNPDKHHTPGGDHANLCYSVRRQNALPLGFLWQGLFCRDFQAQPTRFRLPLSLTFTGSRDRRGEPTTTVGQQSIFPGIGDEGKGNKDAVNLGFCLT